MLQVAIAYDDPGMPGRSDALEDSPAEAVSVF
jgi:hypothetical protein